MFGLPQRGFISGPSARDRTSFAMNRKEYEATANATLEKLNRLKGRSLCKID
jgi:hypothetical protein